MIDMKWVLPYDGCPTYETPSFLLRPVQLEDAEALLACYADPVVAARCNTDHCIGGFDFQTQEQMRRCIAFWQAEYDRRMFVRFAVVARQTGTAVGTVEMFGGETGVLRIDLSQAWEARAAELAKLAIDRWYLDFGTDRIVTRVDGIPERREAFGKLGFVASDFRADQGYVGYAERVRLLRFNGSRGVARCGLACCVCSENDRCEGCRRDGCRGAADCEIRRCVLEHGLRGCWDCAEFPCGQSMLARERKRAFLRFIAQYGEARLMDALERNERAGIQYHYFGEIVGDYDRLDSEEAALDLLENGLER